MSVISKQSKAKGRARRVRAKILGTAERPRLSIHVSSAHIFAQLIDDQAGKTLASARTPKSLSKKDQPLTLGKLIAEQALGAGIKTVIFDRGSKKYHGRVKALAEAARANGLIF